MILDGVDLNVRKLFVVFKRLRIIAPEAGLCFEMQARKQRTGAFEIRLFDEDVRWQPQTRLQIQAPAIEVQEVAVAGARRISTVKADDVVLAVFNPDPAQKASAGVVLRLHIDHGAAHFPEKFLTDVFEVVVFLLEIPVEHDHLREAHGQKLAGKNARERVQRAQA